MVSTGIAHGLDSVGVAHEWALHMILIECALLAGRVARAVLWALQVLSGGRCRFAGTIHCLVGVAGTEWWALQVLSIIQLIVCVVRLAGYFVDQVSVSLSLWLSHCLLLQLVAPVPASRSLPLNLSLPPSLSRLLSRYLSLSASYCHAFSLFSPSFLFLSLALLRAQDHWRYP